MVLQFPYLMDLSKSYQPEKFQYSKFAGSYFTEELQKYNDDVIMASLQILRFEIFVFCESTYRLPIC